LPPVLAGNVADRHLEKAMSASATRSAQKITDDVLVDLALQGGGAHGAFSWGVLDRLLEEKRLRIDGISGTSAGAMNAAALAARPTGRR
jgi:NTE family protein